VSEQRFEERRRAARWRRIRPYLLGFLAIGLVAGGVWLVWFSDVLTVRDVRVQGMTTLSAKSIRDRADVPIGVQLARIDRDVIATRVAQMERIKHVEVGRRWPNTVRIEVEERKPVGWVMSAGWIRQVDRDGIDFRTLPTEPQNLIEIRVESTDPRRRQQALEAAARVITFLRAHAPDLLRDAEYVSAASKDSIRLELDGDRTVVWGSVERPEKKLTVLRALLRIRAERYDVSAPEQPTTRSEPTDGPND
jgi:cell division protein FtsQ